MSDLRAIVYVSSATRPIAPSELDELLMEARARNAKLGITGCLLFCDGNFMQYLEGPAESVSTVYALIRGDRRHTDVYQICEVGVVTREFDGWLMACSEAQLEDFMRLREAQWAADESAASLPPPRQIHGVGLLHDFWTRHQPRSRSSR